MMAPDSLALARSYGNLGYVLGQRGGLHDAAEPSLRKALAIQERLAPDSLDVAKTIRALAVVARERGDLDAAKRLARRALTIEQQHAPGSLDVAGSLHTLGLIAREKGAVEEAEDLLRQALALQEKLAPGSLPVASSLRELGIVARDRGDLRAAEDLLRQDPDSIDLVVLDMKMPKRSGADTFKALRVIKPDLKVILLSGYSLNDEVDELLDSGAYDFIEKPYNVRDLSLKVTKAIRAR